jgi:hypothetical protein
LPVFEILRYPAKADVEAQQQFHDECLQPVIADAKADQCPLSFMDATHLVMGGVSLVFGTLFGFDIEWSKM